MGDRHIPKILHYNNNTIPVMLNKYCHQSRTYYRETKHSEEGAKRCTLRLREADIHCKIPRPTDNLPLRTHRFACINALDKQR